MKRFTFKNIKKYQVGGSYEAYIPHTKISLDPVTMPQATTLDSNVDFGALKPKADKSALAGLRKDVKLEGLTGSVNLFQQHLEQAEQLLNQLTPIDILAQSPAYQKTIMTFNTILSPGNVNALKREKEQYDKAYETSKSNKALNSSATLGNKVYIKVLDKDQKPISGNIETSLATVTPENLITFAEMGQIVKPLTVSELASIRETSMHMYQNYEPINSMNQSIGIEKINEEILKSISNIGHAKEPLYKDPKTKTELWTHVMTLKNPYSSPADKQKAKEAIMAAPEEDVFSLIMTAKIKSNRAGVTSLSDMYDAMSEDEKTQIKTLIANNLISGNHNNVMVQHFKDYVKNIVTSKSSTVFADKGIKDYETLKESLAERKKEMIDCLQANPNDATACDEKKKQLEQEQALFTNVVNSALNAAGRIYIYELVKKALIHELDVDTKIFEGGDGGAGGGGGGIRTRYQIGFYESVVLGDGARKITLKMGDKKIESVASRPFSAIRINSNESSVVNFTDPQSVFSHLVPNKEPQMIVKKGKEYSTVDLDRSMIHLDHMTTVNIIPVLVDSTGNILSKELQAAFSSSLDIKDNDTTRNLMYKIIQSALQGSGDGESIHISDFIQYIKDKVTEYNVSSDTKKKIDEKSLESLNKIIERFKHQQIYVKPMFFVQNAYYPKSELEKKVEDIKSYNEAFEISTVKAEAKDNRITKPLSSDTFYKISFFTEVPSYSSFRALDQQKTPAPFFHYHVETSETFRGKPLGEQKQEESKNKQGGILEIDKKYLELLKRKLL